VSVGLVIQHAKRIRSVILSSVVCLAYNISPHYAINGTNFGGKKVTEHENVF